MKPTDETLMLLTRGPFAGRVTITTVAEAEEAEREGWAEFLHGRDSTFVFSTPKVGKHEAAEAWLAKRIG